MTLCEMKVRHLSEESARIALAGLRETKKSKRKESRVYFCNFCQGWHVTSKTLR